MFFALCRPPAQIHALDLLGAPRISWSSLRLKGLVQRLHKLNIEVRSDCIRRLPSNERVAP